MAASSAASAQAHQLRAQGVSLPQSRSYEDVRLYSNGWAEERGIDWSDTVIRLVPLALQNDR